MKLQSAKNSTEPTTVIPVTTLEEVPALSDEEQAALVCALHAAEAQVAAGQALDYDSPAFKARLTRIFAA